MTKKVLSTLYLQHDGSGFSVDEIASSQDLTKFLGGPPSTEAIFIKEKLSSLHHRECEGGIKNSTAMMMLKGYAQATQTRYEDKPIYGSVVIEVGQSPYKSGKA